MEIFIPRNLSTLLKSIPENQLLPNPNRIVSRPSNAGDAAKISRAAGRQTLTDPETHTCDSTYVTTTPIGILARLERSNGFLRFRHDRLSGDRAEFVCGRVETRVGDHLADYILITTSDASTAIDCQCQTPWQSAAPHPFDIALLTLLASQSLVNRRSLIVNRFLRPTHAHHRRFTIYDLCVSYFSSECPLAAATRILVPSPST